MQSIFCFYVLGVGCLWLACVVWCVFLLVFSTPLGRICTVLFYLAPC